MDRYMYGATDEKFIREDVPVLKLHQTYKFQLNPLVLGKREYDKHDISIVFKVSSDKLINLAAKVVDALPLPMVFTWTNVDVCRWIREYGYPQYQRTFRENYINGRSLLLIDAAALSSMNIKYFDHIRHITYGIRCLFFFEMTKFARSISLPPHLHYDLYKLFRVKSGLKYETVRRTDLWRCMHLLRNKTPNYSHWELLERWLGMEPEKDPELVGGVRRLNLYKCKDGKPVETREVPCSDYRNCHCMPPCECHWRIEGKLRKPWRFSCLPERPPDKLKLNCPNCMGVCTCHWSTKNYMGGVVLSALQKTIPDKYGHASHQRYSIKSDKSHEHKRHSSKIDIGHEHSRRPSIKITNTFIP